MKVSHSRLRRVRLRDTTARRRETDHLTLRGGGLTTHHFANYRSHASPAVKILHSDYCSPQGANNKPRSIQL